MLNTLTAGIDNIDAQTLDLLLLSLVTGLLIGVVSSLLALMLVARGMRRHIRREAEVEFDAIKYQLESRLALTEHDQESLRRDLAESKKNHSDAQLLLDEKIQLAQAAELSLATAKTRLQHMQELQQQFQQAQQQLTQSQQQCATLESQLGQERKHHQEQMALLNDAKVQLSKEFENLANRVFDNKQKQFSEQSKMTLESSIAPVRQQLKEFRQRVDEVYDKENAERNKLAGQVLELQKQAQQIGEDAIKLANALKGDKKAQGNWGEVVLERLLEESGLQKGREYETQVSLQDDSGQRRAPDVIIRLPDNKDLVIDAKVSLVDYERYCNTDDDDERQEALKAHIAALRNHIQGLSIKSYEKLEGVRTLDFVFIFIPIETAFITALEHEPALFREAYNKQIALVSPSTLLVTLRTIEHIWRYEKQNKNAEKIALQAGRIYDQVALVVESLDDVGKNIQRTQESYDKVRNRLVHSRGNLVKRVDDIRKLGAKSSKSIAQNTLADAGVDEINEKEVETLTTD